MSQNWYIHLFKTNCPSMVKNKNQTYSSRRSQVYGKRYSVHANEMYMGRGGWRWITCRNFRSEHGTKNTTSCSRVLFTEFSQTCSHLFKIVLTLYITYTHTAIYEPTLNYWYFILEVFHHDNTISQGFWHTECVKVKVNGMLNSCKTFNKEPDILIWHIQISIMW